MDPNARLPETQDGSVLYNLDPVILRDHYEIDYVHSYAQDSPFFAGLAQGRLRSTFCPACGYRYGTPRAHCRRCGHATEWFDLPLTGAVHTYTTCYYSGEAFLADTPFTLILVEWPGVDSLFLSRLVGAAPDEVHVGLPVRARFRRLSKFRVSDVYFVPVATG